MGRLTKFAILLALIFSCKHTWAQDVSVTVSGATRDKVTNAVLPFVSVVIKNEKDSSLIAGTISNEEGVFSISSLKPGSYLLELSMVGYATKKFSLYVGSLSAFLDLKTIDLDENTTVLEQVEVVTKQDEVSGKMDKKTFNVEDNTTQSGGSILQAMQNLPGVTVQEGKVQLRGNEKVAILIDGKQTAITGFGNQNGLDNIPASAIEKIEIINNPNAKYDANGNAGIINIIMKKNKKEGFTGKAGVGMGAGALWIKKKNLPNIRPQYQTTPKINPSLSLNFLKKKLNLFLQSDYLYTETLNKNEFVTRNYEDGTIIKQQTKRNRNTHFANVKAGIDYNINDRNSFSFSGLFGSEKIIDNGDEPFYNSSVTDQLRLWQFLEDELKTTLMATTAYQHKFKQPGRVLNAGLNYTFHRENEKYFFNNIYPSYTGHDAFKLLSDEQVIDLNVDYIQPLKYGRFETGLKLRKRDIPTNMQFYPGINSPLDTNAGGWATYSEIIPALYGNYIYENKKIEAELGLRVEYVDLKYDVNPDHKTYKSDGYTYTQPFPNLRFAYKFNDRNKISLFYNRRVDRPNEVDIRIFPKYDDAEIIKVGNPALKPQFTNSFEVGWKTSWKKGYWYSSAYHKIGDATISRISTTVPGSKLIYAIFQNAGRSYNTGIEIMVSQQITKWYTFNVNLNAYHNQFDAFTVKNLYPAPHLFSIGQQEIYSGNIKLNNMMKLPKDIEAQITMIYLAPDLIPQGKIGERFSLDCGIKKKIQKGMGEIFLNATDILNTMNIRKDVQGDGFHYRSVDYYETQVIRLGFTKKF